MSKEASKEFLTEFCGQILEDAAFIFVDPADDPEDWDGEVIEAKISIETPDGKGFLMLSSSEIFGMELAANLLGVEPDDDDVMGKGSDAIAEILNIIGGAMVSELYGPDVICKLGIPEVTKYSPEEYDAKYGENDKMAVFTTDGGHRIDVMIEIQPGR